MQQRNSKAAELLGGGRAWGDRLAYLLAPQSFEAPARLHIGVGAREDRKYETNAIFLKNKIDRAILALPRQPESHRTSTFEGAAQNVSRNGVLL